MRRHPILTVLGLVLCLIGGAVTANEALEQRYVSQADAKAATRDDCKIVSARFSARPVKGQVADLEITVKNVGTTTWAWTDASHFYALGIGPAGQGENYKVTARAIWVSHPGGEMPDGFQGNRATLQKSERIAPGQTKIFRCRVEYKEAGVRYVMLQMLRENGMAVGQKNGDKADGWFGERMRVLVTITE